MAANKKYKDSVFTLLFREPGRMIGLYNALAGGDVPADAQVEDVTLENALFMDRVNDLAFIIGGRFVVLVEHQSTIYAVTCCSQKKSRSSKPTGLALKKLLQEP